MKKPEDIPQRLIDAVREAATGRVGLPDEMTDGTIVTILAAVWDDIYAHGYTDGFQDQEGLEIQAGMLTKGEWAPRIFIWMDGANEEQADAVLDAITDHAYANKPDGVALTFGAVLAPGKKHFPTRGVSTT